MVEQAKLEATDYGLVPRGDAWFVLNARDARWRPSEGRGAYCLFEGDPEFRPSWGARPTVLRRRERSPSRARSTC